MRETIFWVVFLAALGIIEILVGVKLFRDEHVSAGITLGALGVISLMLSGIIGVIG